MKKIILGLVIIAISIYCILAILPKLPHVRPFQQFPLTVLFYGGILVGLALILRRGMEVNKDLAEKADYRKKTAELADMRGALDLPRNVRGASTNRGQISYEFDVSLQFYELLKKARSGSPDDQKTILRFIKKFSYSPQWLDIVARDEDAALPKSLSEIYYSLKTEREVRSMIDSIMDIIVHHKRVEYKTTEDIWTPTSSLVEGEHEFPEPSHFRTDFYSLAQFMAKDFNQPQAVRRDP